jgi:hypothetical protein
MLDSEDRYFLFSLSSLNSLHGIQIVTGRSILEHFGLYSFMLQLFYLSIILSFLAVRNFSRQTGSP